jgi:replicative DNA helicase
MGFRLLNRELPVSQDTERQIFSAIFLDQRNPNECFLQAASRLKPEDFGLDSHRKLFTYMLEIHEAGKPIEYQVLWDHVGKDGMDAMGGLGYITDLVSPTQGWPLKNIDAYVDIVLKNADQRKIIHATFAAAEQAYDRETPSDIIGQLCEHIERVSERSQKDKVRPASELVEAVCTDLMERHRNAAKFIGLPTPIGRFNFTTGGLVKKENIVVAGDTGTGKTAFALNVTETNCLSDNPVGWFSMEMDKESLLLRLASSQTGINHWKIRNASNLAYDEALKVVAALQEIKKWPLWIDDTGGLTIRDMYARGRMMAARGIKLIVSDYLQKLRAPGSSPREQVNNASECVRELAKSGNVPVLNLSQLARLEKTSKDSNLRKPTMHDLKESGNIEQDAHIVALLWREYKRIEEILTATGNDVMIIGKNRNGPTVEIAVEYHPRLMIWSERGNEQAAGSDGKAAASGN